MPEDNVDPAAAAAAAAAAQKPWFDGKLDGEYLGHAQTKGWDKLTPAEAAIVAIKSHRDAEKLIGAPADKMVRLADPNDEAATKAMWQRLGAPADAKDYDFSTVKTSDGKDIDPKLADALRGAAASANAPKDVAARLADAVVKFNDAQTAEQVAAKAATVATEKGELQKNWGTNFEPNKFVAQKGAEKLGFSAEQIAALENTAGYAKTMEAMRRVGELSGEAKFVNDPNNPTGVMTREQAMAQKSTLMADTAWVTRYLAGGAAEVREMTALNIILTPEK